MPPAERVLVFDTETTGTDPRKDQVIELCLQFGLDESAEVKVWRCRPTAPMTPGAEAVHGISMADLQGCPPFAAIADEVRANFAQADVLVGYNMRFDVEMLQAEYHRLRQAPLELGHALFVDPLRLWQRSEQRRLVDAHRRFVGGDFDAAHSAAADVAATGRVLLGMRDSFGLGAKSWEEVADVIDPMRKARIGGTQHIRWTEDGDVVIDFGKHRGQRLGDIAAGPNSGYLRWIRDKDFPAHVRDACDAALRLSPAELHRWLHERFGPAPDLK
ncbi:MAG: 3'-5' exonuclease [Myxococcales bacterium]|nr:3'-5' exonuclease [Myxococcales bacterium]